MKQSSEPSHYKNKPWRVPFFGAVVVRLSKNKNKKSRKSRVRLGLIETRLCVTFRVVLGDTRATLPQSGPKWECAAPSLWPLFPASFTAIKGTDDLGKKV